MLTIISIVPRIIGLALKGLDMSHPGLRRTEFFRSSPVYKGHSVRILPGRDAETWKIRMAYVN